MGVRWNGARMIASDRERWRLPSPDAPRGTGEPKSNAMYCLCICYSSIFPDVKFVSSNTSAHSYRNANLLQRFRVDLSGPEHCHKPLCQSSLIRPLVNDMDVWLSWLTIVTDKASPRSLKRTRLTSLLHWTILLQPSTDYYTLFE